MSEGASQHGRANTLLDVSIVGRELQWRSTSRSLTDLVRNCPHMVIRRKCDESRTKMLEATGPATMVQPLQSSMRTCSAQSRMKISQLVQSRMFKQSPFTSLRSHNAKTAFASSRVANVTYVLD